MPNICKINKRGWWILVMDKYQRLPKKESQVTSKIQNIVIE